LSSFFRSFLLSSRSSAVRFIYSAFSFCCVVSVRRQIGRFLIVQTPSRVFFYIFARLPHQRCDIAAAAVASAMFVVAIRRSIVCIRTSGAVCRPTFYDLNLDLIDILSG